jgi:hypothetical protein
MAHWSTPPQFATSFDWRVPEPFRIIGHALLTPFFALMGGLSAQRLYRTRDLVESGA